MSLLRLKAKLLLLLKQNKIVHESLVSRGVDNNSLDELFKEVFNEVSTDTTLSLKKIGKVYDNGFKAIHNFNLEIDNGEFISLLGPSGCGKTTILRMIAGLEYISEGQLKMNDLVLNSAQPKERNLAMVFQNYALYPYMDVYNNIAFGLKIATWNNEVSKQLESQWKQSLDSTLLERLALKAENWKLKNLNYDEIIEMKSRLIKAKNNNTFSKKEIETLKQELASLVKSQKYNAKKSLDQISVNKQRIHELRAKSKLDKKAEKEEYKKNVVKSNEKYDADNVSGQIEDINSNFTIENEKKLKLLSKALKNDSNFIDDLKVKLNNEITRITNEFTEAKTFKKKQIEEIKQSGIKKESELNEDLNSVCEDLSAKLIVEKNELEKKKIQDSLSDEKKISKALVKNLRHSVSDAIKKITSTNDMDKREFNLKMIQLKRDHLQEVEAIKNKTKKIKSEIEVDKSIKIAQIAKLKKSYSSISNTKKIENMYYESVAVWKASIPSRISELAKMVGIDKYLKRKPSALSGGQRQRVALVRAISKDAKLFLYDEPLSNLDAKLRGAMRTEIRSLHEKIGAISIFVTHDQIEAMTMSDKIVLMNRGYIQQIGTPDELFNQPSNVFAADFIGSPRINLMNATLNSANEVITEKIKIKFKKSESINDSRIEDSIGKQVIIGVRPQSVSFSESDILNAKQSMSNIFSGTIKTIENIGHEQILTISSDVFPNNITAVASSKLNTAIDMELDFTINPSSIHIFDNESGVSLTSIINDQTKAALAVWAESGNERIKNMVLSDRETTKERISRKIAKNAYGLVNKKYGLKRNAKISEIKSKIYKDVSVTDINEQIGN